MPGGIFINYRRGDDPGMTGRLFDRLAEAFRPEQLFMDVDSVPPGIDFVRLLDEKVAECDVFLAIIGKGWAEARDATGARRLDNPDDFVRIEIESALRQDKRVVPVLVGEAPMPRSDELPDGLKRLVRRHAVRVTHERFRLDAQGLIKAVQKVLDDAQALRQVQAAARQAMAEEDRSREQEAANERAITQHETKVRARRHKEEARAAAIADLSREQIGRQQSWRPSWLQLVIAGTLGVAAVGIWLLVENWPSAPPVVSQQPSQLATAPRAQQTGRVWRVAVIGMISPLPAMLSAFREALQQRGWTEGKNLSIDVHWPKGSFAQEPGLIPEVLRSNVDVIVAWATPSALAAQRATLTIPIVFLGISDPVGSGLAASLAHPGGNATGSSNAAPDLIAKLLGMFVQLVPDMSRVGVVVNPANPGAVAQMAPTQQAVHALGLQSQVVNAGTLEEYERAFARLKIDGVNGVLFVADPSNERYQDKIAELTQQYRLPTAFQLRTSVAAGGLMSYGADNNDQFRLAAFYVDRILRGEKPADLPVQLPTKFDLAINLKTAKALGITVPPALLAIATEVIE